ncbi:uncharacterized protein LOC118488895 [Helianthus annuus]|uniref:uncharacterized protein LOC118488895 n=1 Tax=Helianthus annuus TaxID=4232 RepID=UPI0016531E28|nr:uncharacterized protein LOC118488895 [Helianthus annuus]
MEMDKIPAAAALKRRNIQIDNDSCPFCNSNEETVEHVFIGCLSASIVWNFISSWCKIPSIFAFSLKDLLSIHKELSASDKKKEAAQGIMSIACWSLWRARNNTKFFNFPFKIDRIISEIKALGYLWFVNRSRYKEVEWGDWCSFVNM